VIQPRKDFARAFACQLEIQCIRAQIHITRPFRTAKLIEANLLKYPRNFPGSKNPTTHIGGKVDDSADPIIVKEQETVII
jgi:hypothetical protein